MDLSGKFFRAGGGSIPGIVNATQEVDSQRLTGADFLRKADQIFGDNAQDVSLSHTADFV